MIVSKLKKQTYAAFIPLLLITSCSNNLDDDKIKNYIASHPEEIINAVTSFRDKNIKELQNRQIYVTERMANRFGKQGKIVFNPLGNINVIEIIDYNCGYCKSSFSEIQHRLKGKWKDVRLTVIPLPILGKSSMTAVLATRSENRKGGQAQLLMKKLINLPLIDDVSARKVTKTLSLNTSNIERFKGEVERDMKIANAISIKATPTFIISGHTFMGFKEGDIGAAIVDARKNISD